MRNFIQRMLTPLISPMVYIMMGVSVIWGFGYAFLPGLPEIQNSLLHQYGTLIGINMWGAVLMVGASIALIGIIRNIDGIIKAGSMVAFVAWLFACITYVDHHLYFALIVVGLFQSIFQAYVYLATSLGLLKREPVDKTFDPWYTKEQ